jgi:PAS domain S-box-containing protein
MISTRWQKPDHPKEHELRTLDVLARQAADLIERNEVEAALRESRERFWWLASIIELSDDAIISKTLDGIMTSWNKGAERLFGYLAEEAVGRPVTIAIPPERHPEETVITDRIRGGDRLDHFEEWRRREEWPARRSITSTLERTAANGPRAAPWRAASYSIRLGASAALLPSGL